MSVHGVSDNKHLKETDPISHKTLLLVLCVSEYRLLQEHWIKEIIKNNDIWPTTTNDKQSC